MCQILDIDIKVLVKVVSCDFNAFQVVCVLFKVEQFSYVFEVLLDTIDSCCLFKIVHVVVWLCEVGYGFISLVVE